MLVRFGRVSWYEAAYPDPSLGALAVRDRSPMSSLAHVDDADLRSRMDALSWNRSLRLLTGADFWSLYPEPAAGLRRLVVSDVPVGARREVGRTGAVGERALADRAGATWGKAGSWWLPQA